jgi:hypothetical protein
MKKALLVLIPFFLVVSFLLTGCKTSSEKPIPQIPQFVNENEEFGVDINYYKVEEEFSKQYALEMDESTVNIFDSFRKLTEKCKGLISQKALDEIGNTSWEMQYIGFSNIPRIIKGTLIRDDYEISKLELELAIKQYQDKEITYEELMKKDAKYKQAKEEFQNFLKGFGIAD